MANSDWVGFFGCVLNKIPDFNSFYSVTENSPKIKTHFIAKSFAQKKSISNSSEISLIISKNQKPSFLSKTRIY